MSLVNYFCRRSRAPAFTTNCSVLISSISRINCDYKLFLSICRLDFVLFATLVATMA